MLKHEYLACIELHKRIKEEITGDVFVTINDNDSLIIRICGKRGIRFSYEYKNISFEMMYGELNYNKVVRLVIREYEEFILKKFFRR